MSWQLLILISVTFYSFSTLLQRVLLKDDESDPVAFSIFFQLFVGFLLGAFGLLTTEMAYPNIVPMIPSLALMTFLYAAANILIFRSLKISEASTFTVVFSARALFTVAASAVFLGERLTGMQLLGALLVVSGAAFASLDPKKFKLGKGTPLTLAAAAAYGTANTNDKFLLGSFDLYPYLFAAFALPAVFIALIYPKKVKKIKPLLKGKTLGKISILSVIYAVSAVTFFKALKVAASSAQVATANLTSVVVTVLLAAVFLKERKNLLQKIAAAVISFLGLLLVS